ncbi:LysR family transcriptional regulator [Alcaligenes endophyticus]|uniref:LysR family transcriptional regulator n=1 Tax=Alcaligenes endophyticus TaxID=1929088 RepID=A0ABT8EKT6_9BURK|nr:LysR family transcriptional regulator [Alcaligenes endophyticus]MCX5590723.1 LysR family transcriptional regulator [Alcaligenes endophyticus]MDN4121913.1 LysR family transcriptional regulator [Alcaligenes endophyticus]
MNLTTRQLRGFVALAHERHFTRAAERCHMTQPAFSALIRQIEQELGLRLFERSTRHVDLTPEGQQFLVGAERLLADFEQLREHMEDYAHLRQGRVAVAALPSLAAGWLPQCLAHYHRLYPGVRLELRDALLEPCLDMVRHGQVDFGVAALGADMSGLDKDFLYAERFFVVCSEDHVLAAQKALRLEQLVGYPHIQLARSSSVRQALERVSEPVPPLLEVEHLATVTGLVAAGLGISVVPEMTLFHFQRNKVVVIPLKDRHLRRRLYLVRRQGVALSTAAQEFYETLLNEPLSLSTEFLQEP